MESKQSEKWKEAYKNESNRREKEVESQIKVVDDISERMFNFFEKYKKSDFSEPMKYKSLPLCMIEMIYSLNRKNTVTNKIINNYRKNVYTLEYTEKDDTVDNLIRLMREGDDLGNNIDLYRCYRFSWKYLNSLQKISRGKRLRAETLLELADLLKSLGINTVDDFRGYSSNKLGKEELQLKIDAISGIGQAGVDYLFILTRADDRCKVDVNIKNFIRTNFTKNKRTNFSYDCYLDIMRKSAQKLVLNGNLDKTFCIAKLDRTIWNIMVNGNFKD